jgi:hypothetical protein
MKGRLRMALAVFAAAALGLIAAPAMAKIARCDIRTSDGSYAAQCVFTPTGGGSFSIGPMGRDDFFAHAKADPGIVEIEVQVQGSHADVRGVTSDGVDSYWGPAARSTKDPACWVGADFSICAY